MAPNYKVASSVVDIRVDIPRAGDVFLVDTNVWYWTTYQRASQADDVPDANQLTHYPSYLAKAVRAGASIYRSELSFSELAHLIERSEAQIMRQNLGREKYSAKDFRHSGAPEVASCRKQIATSWAAISRLSQSVSCLANEASTAAAIAALPTVLLDPYDLLILQTAREAGVLNFLTDDGDFSTIAGISVYTANERVLGPALRNGRIISRPAP